MYLSFFSLNLRLAITKITSCGDLPFLQPKPTKYPSMLYLCLQILIKFKLKVYTLTINLLLRWTGVDPGWKAVCGRVGVNPGLSIIVGRGAGG